MNSHSLMKKGESSLKYSIIALITVFLMISILYVYGTRLMTNQYVRPKYILMANEIISDVASILKERHKMNVVAVTEGMADCVNVVGLSFQILGPLSKERLREIIVDCVEEFLVLINANEPLRPFLKNYPFTSKEIRIAIFVVDSTGIKVYEPEIMLVAQSCGEIGYRMADKEAKFGYKSSEFEDYETALEIVRGNAKK